MENKIYDTVNVNGATIQGAEVVKTVEAKISRFIVKNIGVVSYLFDTEMNLTYIWLHVDSDTEEGDVMIARLSLNGFASQKAIKHYVKSYLLENDIRMNNILSEGSISLWLDTVIEYVNYQGNTVVIFNDDWYDVNMLTTQAKTKSGLCRYTLLEIWVYGMFGGDKLIEVLGQIDYNLKENNQEYPSQILGL